MAEDNDLNAEIAIMILEAMGLIVERVEDGIQCVAKMEQMPAKSYDLILMDIQMPEIDGYEATKLIRMSDHTDAKTIPVLAMTANVLSEDVAKALACGMNGHIGKPIDTKNLYHVLEKFMK